MKKLIFLLFIIGCTFTSCELQEDVEEINVEEVTTDEDDGSEGSDPGNKPNGGN